MNVLKLPKFEEFIQSLSEKDWNEIKEINIKSTNTFIKNSPNNAQLGNSIFAISLQTSINLLKKYHEWLNEQIL